MASQPIHDSTSIPTVKISCSTDDSFKLNLPDVYSLLGTQPVQNSPGMKQRKMIITPRSDFSLEDIRTCGSHGKSTDRFIPSRKSSTIRTKMDFVEGSHRQNPKNIVLSKFKCKILGLSENDKSLRYSSAEENPNSTIPEFISDKYYESVQSQQRTVAKTPFKILDAPSLEDDFYLSLLDWSHSNLLCVGLTSMVYVWASDTCKVTKLCQMYSKVTAVACSNHSNQVAVATNSGKLQLHDLIKLKTMTQLEDGTNNRVGTLHWSSKLLAAGSGDKNIYVYDVRTHRKVARRFHAHKQQICGIKWSYDDQQLASGGNDNKLCIWDLRMQEPLFKFYKHQAAIKGLSWSPHQHGLLASGGGARDRTIKFWNTMEGRQTHSIDTESQVCNLLFSKNTNQLVSTHGYTQNQIMFWKTRNLEHFDTLVGHRLRVLYIALSPDGRTIVTGGGDQTLRFWNVFPQSKSNICKSHSTLTLNENFLH